MAVRIGTGLSEDPDPRAGAYVAGVDARAELGGAPADAVLVFAAGEHLDAPELTLEGVRDALEPRTLAGCSAGGVLAGRHEVEYGTAVSVWAIALDGEGTGAAAGAAVEAFHCEAVDGPEGPTITDLPDPLGASALVLLPDPLSFPVDVALRELTAEAPLVPILGGLASARTANGSMALFLDDEVLEGGAVGLRFSGVDVLPGVAQGAAPVGPELTVTAAEGNVILELAGRPALAALQDAIETLDTVERALVSGGLLLGIVVDSDKPEYRTGDFLVRGLLGADPASGAVALGHDVRPGQVVRLHARDAGSADRDLRSLLELQRAALGGETPAGALVFSCNGRGEAMFGARGHDAETVADELGDCPAAGFFAAGEIGPVGGEAHLHGFTAIMATFGR